MQLGCFAVVFRDPRRSRLSLFRSKNSSGSDPCAPCSYSEIAEVSIDVSEVVIDVTFDVLDVSGLQRQLVLLPCAAGLLSL